VKRITSSDDKPLATQGDPETVDGYIIHRPKTSLLDLKMLDNYDNQDPASSGYILPKDRKSGSWEITDIKETE